MQNSWGGLVLARPIRQITAVLQCESPIEVIPFLDLLADKRDGLWVSNDFPGAPYAVQVVALWLYPFSAAQRSYMAGRDDRGARARKPLKKQVHLVIDEESFRSARERPEAKEALNRLAGHIAEVFIKGLPDEDAALLMLWFDTAEGKEALRETWPKIVDAYFHALCNPKR
jgi:hypothetical protein